MMKIKMTRDARGCDDGIHAADYAEGETYDVSDALAGAFIGDGAAEPAGKPSSVPAQAEAPVVKPAKNTAQKAPQRRKAGAKKS